jgi:hypothetical protein
VIVHVVARSAAVSGAAALFLLRLEKFPAAARARARSASSAVSVSPAPPDAGRASFA